MGSDGSSKILNLCESDKMLIKKKIENLVERRRKILEAKELQLKAYMPFNMH